jgi:outer membrane protein OmpA-like peptidoglycan-associated protein
MSEDAKKHGHGGHDGGHGGGAHEEHGGHKGPHEEKPMGAPGWIVSFADMIINLLCFFILMNTFAAKPQCGFVADGIGAFKGTSVTTGGPSAIGGGEIGAVDLGASKVRYRPPDAVNPKLLEEESGDAHDANRDSLRQTIKKSLLQEGVSRVPIEIIFAPGEHELSGAHRQALDVVGATLRNLSVNVRIDGYAYAEPCDDIRDMAVRRADAVRNYLVKRHGIAEARLRTVGFGSSGAGAEKHKNRVVQDRLGRRIALLYIIPPS